MFNRIQIREILAWMTLAIALILFSVTIAFAQTKTINIENEDGKVHIKIIKTENGKTVRIDTTFTVTDDMNVDEIIESLGERDGANSPSHSGIRIHKDEGISKNKKQIVIDFDVPEMSKAEKEKLRKNLNESMKDMRHGLGEMNKSLRSMHIHIDNDFDNKNDFHFNYDLPDAEAGDKNDCDAKSYAYKFSNSDNNGIDSLKDDDHIVIIGDKDEKPPVLEKVISSKKGKQIFVYKRSGSSRGSGKNENVTGHDDQKANKPDIHNLHYYPNPTSGKIKLTFRSDEKGDITIQVLDGNSKEVFSEKINDFEGGYSKEIDLGGRSKGNYFLKIVQGEKSITKKIVLN